jgi:hypothetical protein
MTSYHLAQLNIARLLAPIDSPTLVDFVANLDRINALAEASPGYVWRLKSDAGDATSIRPFGEDYIVNLSVWEDIESLHNYVYRSGHIEIMRRRKEWFGKMAQAYSVLWWVPRGHIPTALEAKERLMLLQSDGPTGQAFTFKKPYPAPDSEPGQWIGEVDGARDD